MRRRRRRITSQVRKGLCVYCTNSWFTFSNSSFPGLLELSAVSLTSQMNYVRSIDLQSNIIHGSVCSIKLIFTCCDIALMNIYMCTYETTICSACNLLHTMDFLRTAIQMTYSLANHSAQYSQTFCLGTALKVVRLFLNNAAPLQGYVCISWFVCPFWCWLVVMLSPSPQHLQLQVMWWLHISMTPH